MATRDWWRLEKQRRQSPARRRQPATKADDETAATGGVMYTDEG